MPDPTVQDVIREEAKRLKVDPDLALAVAEHESAGTFNPGIKGSKGELGVMQLMPNTAKRYGVDASDPRENIRGGIMYLRDLLQKYKSDGDLNKVLAAYNAGEDTVDKGKIPSTTTKTYIPKVNAILDRLAKDKGTPKPQPKPSPAQPTTKPDQKIKPAGPVMKSDPLQQAAANEQARTSANLDSLKRGAIGAVRGAVSTVQTLAKPLRERLGMQPAAPPPAETTLAGKVGRGVEQVAEFAAPGGVARKTFGAARVALAAEAAGVYELSKLHDDPHPVANTLISMVPGFAALRSKQGWYDAAKRSMEKILMKAAESRGEEQATKAVGTAISLAMDRSLLRSTQTKWAQTVKAAKEGAFDDVKAVLASSVGDEPLSVNPVINELEQLKRKHMALTYPQATHPGQVAGGVSAAGAAVGKAVPGHEAEVSLLDAMQEALREAGGKSGFMQARELAIFKQDWDRFVYGSKAFLDPTLVTSFRKTAEKRSADAVRRIIATEPAVKALDEVDKVAHQHQVLYNLISEMSFDAPWMPPGFGIKKQVAKQLIKQVMTAPRWRLMNVQAKLAVADAYASGNYSRLRQVAAPILIGGLKGAEQAVPAPARGEKAPLTGRYED